MPLYQGRELLGKHTAFFLSAPSGAWDWQEGSGNINQSKAGPGRGGVWFFGGGCHFGLRESSIRGPSKADNVNFPLNRQADRWKNAVIDLTGLFACRGWRKGYSHPVDSGIPRHKSGVTGHKLYEGRAGPGGGGGENQTTGGATELCSGVTIVSGFHG